MKILIEAELDPYDEDPRHTSGTHTATGLSENYAESLREQLNDLDFTEIVIRALDDDGNVMESPPSLKDVDEEPAPEASQEPRISDR